MTSSRWKLTASIALALAVTPACRQLEFPGKDLALGDPDAPLAEPIGAPPTVKFASPSDGSAAPRVPFIVVEAEDSNGIASVELTCAGLLLYTWAQSPYQASVDLGACLPTGEPQASVTLEATARDGQGVSSSATLTLQVDGRIPSLALDLPRRLRPGSPLSLTIESSVPLESRPSVRVGGMAAEVLRIDDSPVLFEASVAALPTLAADSWSGEGAPPLEALQELERAVPIDVEGRAENGNVARVTASVTVSRILWERPIPPAYLPLDPNTGTPFATAGRSAAIPGGLILALLDGGYVPTYPLLMTDVGESTLLPLPEDPGGTTELAGFTGSGRPLWLDLELDEYGFSELTTQLIPLLGSLSPESSSAGNPEVFHRLGEWMCAEQIGSPFCDQVESNRFAPRTVLCMHPTEGDFSWDSPLAAQNDNIQTGPSPLGHVVRSGDSLMLASAPRMDCVSGGELTSAYGTLVTPATASVSSIRLTSSGGVSRILPGPDGGFVIQTASPLTVGHETRLIGPDGNSKGFYHQDAFYELMPKNLLATLDDGRLLTGGAKDGATELLTWPPSGGLPTVVLRLPGERSPYDLSEALVSVIDPIWTPSLMTTEGSPGPLVQVIQNEGKTVALFHREPVLDINGDVLLPGSMTVVALDAAGTPRYLHSIQPAPKFAELVGGPDTNVYLVDASHQRVTALTWP